MKDKKKIKFSIPDIFVFLIVIGYSGYMFFQAKGFKKAALNLTLIGPLFYAILFFAVLRLIQCFKRTEENKESPEGVKSRFAAYWEKNKHLVIMMAAAVIYAIGFKLIGFYITTIVVLPLVMYLLGVKKIPVLVGVTVGTMLFFYLGFELWLGVSLPK